MDVKLYVYDLSRGLARQWSNALLGRQIDAVYHTSLVFAGREYFYGAGIQTSEPGRTHHGQPMEIVPMGRTEIDLATVLDYIESLAEVYTAETYDLFANNCNNFTNDLAMFMVGQDIPSHIVNLPSEVLATPFGQMLKPQLDQAMRGVTQGPATIQAPGLPRTVPNGITNGSKPTGDRQMSQPTGMHPALASGKVQNVSNLSQLDSLLNAAKSSGAVIFFTSQTCPPCKICYPAYDALAEEAVGKLVLVKVDISQALDVSLRYQVRATPTFMTFLHGEKLDEWKGADVAALQGNVRLLIEMANPSHPHMKLNIPILRKATASPILYSKVPPLDKVVAKLKDNAAHVEALIKFVKGRTIAKAADVPLPDMPALSHSIRMLIRSIAPDQLFALIDLLRLALLDPRFSGYLAEECEEKEGGENSVLLELLRTVTGTTQSHPVGTSHSYPVLLTTIHAFCNVFQTPLSPRKLLENINCCLPDLISLCVRDQEHVFLRVSAASLAFNISSWIFKRRVSDQGDLLDDDKQLELAVSCISTLSEESNADVAKGLLLALGALAFARPADGLLEGALVSLEAAEVVKTESPEDCKALAQEIAQILVPM